MGIDARSLLLEVLAVVGSPGRLLNKRNAIWIVRDAPSMTVNQSLQITPALLHQRILSANKTAFNASGLVGAQGIQPAHVSSFTSSRTMPPGAPGRHDLGQHCR